MKETAAAQMTTDNNPESNTGVLRLESCMSKRINPTPAMAVLVLIPGNQTNSTGKKKKLVKTIAKNIPKYFNIGTIYKLLRKPIG